MAYFRMYGSNIIVPQTKTMTVILDLNNPDPTTWATYADDAVGMTAGSDAWDTFFGHYPCILENGVELGKLKRSNFAQYENGTSAPITTLGKDVMICFPRRGIKIEYTDSSHLSVSMTDEEGKSGYSYMGHSYKGSSCDKFYLGVYKGYGVSSSLYSISGKTPTTLQTIDTFRNWARARGTGYEQSGHFQLTFRQVMYLLKYKGQNAQVAVGRGFADGNSAVYGNTGFTNDKGMDWGESTGKFPMKLFGLEDFYGNIYEFIDGAKTTNYKLFVSDDYNSTGSGYISAGSSISAGISGFMIKPIGNNLGGFTPDASSYGSATTYFCDATGIQEAQVSKYGGAYSEKDNVGVFRNIYYHINNSGISGIAPYVGSRLMYMHVK